MGIGYIFGCLLSILTWKLDRQAIFNKFNRSFRNKVKNKFVCEIIYGIFMIAVCFGVFLVHDNDIMNFVISFLVIDISNTERKNLNLKDKMHFYDTMSLISKATVCGFVAPLLYIILFGNWAGILYTFIYFYSCDEQFKLFKLINNIANIIPSLVVSTFLYVMYIFRNKSFKIDFKGDFIVNALMMPILNVDVLAAYIESVNFYYYYSKNSMHYLKGYGEYTNKIDNACIKDYLSITYGICFICFIVFCIIMIK